MIFSEKSIQDILSGRKTTTRRLVKEGETLIGKNSNYPSVCTGIITSKMQGEIFHNIDKMRVKWQVGKDYAVQSKRGGKGLLYCSECKYVNLFNPTRYDLEFKRMELPSKLCPNCNSIDFPIKATHIMNPLRVVVTGIRKEKLLDISEEDAKKEGYKTIREFYNAFCEINGKEPLSEFDYLQLYYNPKRLLICSSLDNLNKVNYYKLAWNPFVWVIEFGVLE